MSDKKAKDADLIAKYKAETIARRDEYRAMMSAQFPDAIKGVDGVFTVHFAPGPKSVTELGGPSKVFGESKIWIPE